MGRRNKKIYTPPFRKRVTGDGTVANEFLRNARERRNFSLPSTNTLKESIRRKYYIRC